METKEERNEKRQSEPTQAKASCCGPENISGEMPDCCKDFGKSDKCHTMMAKCAKLCRWFPIIPVILGIALLLLGYYLNPEITRILWMAGAIVVTSMGVLGLIMINMIKRTCCG
jgi:hypothetical protein